MTTHGSPLVKAEVRHVCMIPFLLTSLVRLCRSFSKPTCKRAPLHPCKDRRAPCRNVLRMGTGLVQGYMRTPGIL